MSGPQWYGADKMLMDDPHHPWDAEPHVVPGPVRVHLTDGAGRTRTAVATQVTFTPLPEPQEDR